jgi:hypothetical protein
MRFMQESRVADREEAAIATERALGYSDAARDTNPRTTVLWPSIGVHGVPFLVHWYPPWPSSRRIRKLPIISPVSACTGGAGPTGSFRNEAKPSADWAVGKSADVRCDIGFSRLQLFECLIKVGNASKLTQILPPPVAGSEGDVLSSICFSTNNGLELAYATAAMGRGFADRGQAYSQCVGST